MTFDRYAILTSHYEADLRKWNWDALLKEAQSNEIEGYDSRYGSIYIGSCLNLVPSGKYYMPWTTNQNRSDCIRDECWWAALELVAYEHGLFVGGPDGGDGLDVFLSCPLDDDKADDPG